MRRIIAFLTVLFVATSFRAGATQDWFWIEDATIFNPSGLEILSQTAQFQVLDWDGDGLLDFMINEDGNIRYYRRLDNTQLKWITTPVDLPEVGFIERSFALQPKNFNFIDWDGDGDFDLAADDSKFWWNTSNNASPSWAEADSLLSDIPRGINFFFLDYDSDGDWDATAGSEFSEYSLFFLNEGSNEAPVWTNQDSLDGSRILGLGYNIQFVDWTARSPLDVAAIEPIPADPGIHFGIAQYVNDGTPFEPYWIWRLLPLPAWSTPGRDDFATDFDVADFDQDGLLDVFKTDWDRHIALHRNHGTADSAVFREKPDLILGPVNVDRKALPVFTKEGTNAADLLVAGDRLVDFNFVYYHEGQALLFQNLGGYFDPTTRIEQNLSRLFEYPNTRNSYTFDFVDLDRDGDHDFLLGFQLVSSKDEPTGSGILFFQNKGTVENPDWQPDSTRFSPFLVPDSVFYAPQVIDFDRDGDYDLFVQRGGRYTFYERLNTAEEAWQENPAWPSGIENRLHYQATFADLTRDGLQDIVFGEFDGTLSLYENAGDSGSAGFRLVQGAFEGIDVDSLAAPAFDDLNGDGLLDLVVGNSAGLLFYFENQSTVDVSSPDVRNPTGFHLFQNYPNPFNPETTIAYELEEPGRVTLTIYNLLGQHVAILVDEWQLTGDYQVTWNGKIETTGLNATSGVYFYQLRQGGLLVRRKMALIR